MQYYFRLTSAEKYWKIAQNYARHCFSSEPTLPNPFLLGQIPIIKKLPKKHKKLFLGPLKVQSLQSKISEHHFKANAFMVITVSLSFFVFFKGVSPLTMSRISTFCPKITAYLNFFCLLNQLFKIWIPPLSGKTWKKLRNVSKNIDKMVSAKKSFTSDTDKWYPNWALVSVLDTKTWFLS